MANEVKYANVDWAKGTPIAGERMATNGHYTGEHKGTPMQDAKNPSEANAAHYVDGVTIRYGTLMKVATET